MWRMMGLCGGWTVATSTGVTSTITTIVTLHNMLAGSLIYGYWEGEAGCWSYLSFHNITKL